MTRPMLFGTLPTARILGVRVQLLGVASAMRTSPARAPKSLLAASGGRRGRAHYPPKLAVCVASWFYTAIEMQVWAPVTGFDSIRLQSARCRYSSRRALRTRHFQHVPGANPHPSQVSWTHASPPSHLMPGCTHTHAAPLRRRPALRLYHTHRRRHRRSLRSFTLPHASRGTAAQDLLQG